MKSQDKCFEGGQHSIKGKYSCQNEKEIKSSSFFFTSCAHIWSVFSSPPICFMRGVDKSLA